MTLTPDWTKQLYDYINYQLNRPRPLNLSGGAGADGGAGAPAGGVRGQLPQVFVCYDTSELTTAGSTSTAGSSPSLVHNLNRIRGGWSIGDDAIRERHMYWAAGDPGTSGCIDASHVPFFSSSGCVPDGNVRDAIDWLYYHRLDDPPNYYTWHTFTFTVEGDLQVDTGDLRFYAPGAMTSASAYGSIDTPSVGADIIFDINKNGASILDGSKLVIAAGSNIGQCVPVVTTLAVNDYLTMDVDQRGTTTPGADATVHIRCKQYLQED